MKKSLLSLLSFLITVPAVLASVISTESHGEVIDGIHYILMPSTSTAYVTYCYSEYYEVDEYENDYRSISDYSGDIVIPEKVYFKGTNYAVTSIGWDAFNDCTDLRSVTLPKTITSVMTDAFIGCSNLKTVTCLGQVPPIVHASEETVPYVHHCAQLIVPLGCKSAYQSADGWGKMPSIVEGGSCGKGVNYVFEDNKTLRISGTGNMNHYSSAAKQPWQSVANTIQQVVIEEGVTNVGSYAFAEFKSLQAIVIPQSATQGIGDYSFQNCTSLQSAEILSTSGIITTGVFSGCSQLSSVTISEGIGRIMENAFTGTAILDNQQPERGVKYIDKCAIKYDGVTSDVKIKEGTLLVADRAFEEAAISSVTFPSTLKYIGMSAFSNCHLSEITLPNSLKSIRNSAFCFNRIETISIPASVTYIDQYAFAYNGYLQNVIFEDGVEILSLDRNEFESGVSRGVFGQSENIQYIYVGRDIQFDGFAARGPFYNYASVTYLEEVEIGPTVTTMPSGLFDGHAKIQTVTCQATTIPTLGVRTFEPDVQASAVLYVPAGLVDQYSQASNWADFVNIQEMAPATIDLTDDQVYQNDTDQEVTAFTYSRVYTHTNWQSIILPVDLEYADWSDQFEIAEILGVRIGDGVSVVDGIKLKEGGIAHANVPYMIRALVADPNEPQVIRKGQCILKAADPVNLECSTTKQHFTFVGTYTGVDGPTMYEKQYYAMSGGGWKQVSNNTVSLKPYRCYLMAEDKEGGYQSGENAPARDITVLVYEDETAIPIHQVEERDHKETVLDHTMLGLAPGKYLIHGKTILLK